MSETTARRTTLFVTIGGHDATDWVNPSLLDFSFADHASGKADEVQITLHDRDGKWNGEWMPQKGDVVTASLTVHDWFDQGQNASLACGAFKVDELAFSGPPDKVTIKAVSASLTSGLKDSQRTKAWENVSLEAIASDMAKREGLELLYRGPEHTFRRRDQREESDLSFIHALGDEMGMKVKVHDGKLIVFDANLADQQECALIIQKRGGQFSPSSYSFKLKSADTDYSDCDMEYTEPAVGETYKATASSGHAGAGEKKLIINQRAESQAQAQTMAEAALRNKNEKEAEGSLEIMGHPGVRAGLCMELKGFGAFDGKWFVQKCDHKVGSGGYKTTAELRRSLKEEEGEDDDF